MFSCFSLPSRLTPPAVSHCCSPAPDTQPAVVTDAVRPGNRADAEESTVLIAIVPASSLLLGQAGWPIVVAGAPATASPGSHDGCKSDVVLVPVECNAAATLFFGWKDCSEYAEVLKQLLSNDPLLGYILEQGIADCLAGAAPGFMLAADHPTPCLPPSNGLVTSASADLLHVSLAAGTWTPPQRPGAQGSRVFPAVLVGHRPTASHVQVTARVSREPAIMAQLTEGISLLDLAGTKFEYQNTASVRYHGHLTGSAVLALSTARSGDGTGRTISGPLQHLFKLEPHELDDMLMVVRQGRLWRKVIQAPTSGRRTSQQMRCLLCRSPQAARLFVNVIVAGGSLSDSKLGKGLMDGKSLGHGNPQDPGTRLPQISASLSMCSEAAADVAVSPARYSSAGTASSIPNLQSLSDALATSGWRHARVRSNMGRKGSAASTGSAAPGDRDPHTINHCQTPRIALVTGKSGAWNHASIETIITTTAATTAANSMDGRPSGEKGQQGRLSFASGLLQPPPQQQEHQEQEHQQQQIHHHQFLQETVAVGGGNTTLGVSSFMTSAEPTSVLSSAALAPLSLARSPTTNTVWENSVATVQEDDGTAPLQQLPSLHIMSKRIPRELVMKLDELDLGFAAPHNAVRDHVYKEICATPLHDAVTGTTLLLLRQNDVTLRVEAEKALAELNDSQLSLLEAIFPRHVLHHMTVMNSQIMGTSEFAASLGELAAKHEGVTVFFMDVCGFTDMSKQVEPVQVMTLLSQLFSRLDDLVDQHGLHKLETAGDAYLVAGNLMDTDEDGFMALHVDAPTSSTIPADRAPDGHAFVSTDQGPGELLAHTRSFRGGPRPPVPSAAAEGAAKVFCFARDVLAVAQQVLMPHTQEPVQVRIGLHTGSLVSGVIGTKLPKFGCFGDTMNTGARMEQTSRPGCIQMSTSTRALLPADLDIPATGGVEVKGKGILQTYLWDPEVCRAPESMFENVLLARQTASLTCIPADVPGFVGIPENLLHSSFKRLVHLPNGPSITLGGDPVREGHRGSGMIGPVPLMRPRCSAPGDDYVSVLKQRAAPREVKFSVL